MGKFDISKVTRKLSKIGRKIKKNGPEIMVFLGLGSMTYGTIDAVRATTKLDGVLDECKMDIEAVKANSDCMTKRERSHKLAGAYVRSAGRIGKLYSRSAITFVTGGASVVGGTVKRRNQYRDMAATLATTSAAYSALRQSIVDKLGTDQANDIIYGVEEKTVVTTNENNELKEEKVKVLPGPSSCPPCTPFAIIINDTPRKAVREKIIEGVSREYVPDVETMVSVAEDFKHLMDTRLVQKGVIEYNADIRDFFFLPYVKEGFNMGKIYDPKKDVNNQFDVYIYKGFRETLDYRGRTVLEPIVKIDFDLDGGISESDAFERLTD